MHLRKWRKRVKGRMEEYWAVVESYRTARGRQRLGRAVSEFSYDVPLRMPR